MDGWKDAVRHLVDYHFHGNGSAALVALAEVEGIAVHYLDRDVIESRSRPLTDEEWARVRLHLDDYDEWLENSGTQDSIDYWVWDVLEEEGITPEGGAN